MSVLPKPSRAPRWGVVLLTCIVSLLPIDAIGANVSATEDGANEAETTETAGLSLGHFSLRDVRGSEGTKVRLDFTLYATFDEDKLRISKRLLKQYENRIRDQVLVAVRLCETKEFQEPELQRVKRRILLRLKRAAPKLEIQQLHFHEFTFFTD